MGFMDFPMGRDFRMGCSDVPWDVRMFHEIFRCSMGFSMGFSMGKS